MSAPVTQRTRFLDLVSLAVLFVVVGLLVLPGSGPLWKRWDAWRQARQMSVELQKNWPGLAGAGHVLGQGTEFDDPPFSDVRMVVFSDYQCPYCRHLDAQLRRLRADGSLQNPVLLRHWPLASHPAARVAAIGAICAEQVNEFNRMHEYLMGTEEWFTMADAVEFGDAAGIASIEEYRSCVASDLPDSVLVVDAEYVRRLQMIGTPTIVTISGRHSGSATDQQLVEMNTKH